MCSFYLVCAFSRLLWIRSKGSCDYNYCMFLDLLPAVLVFCLKHLHLWRNDDSSWRCAHKGARRLFRKLRSIKPTCIFEKIIRLSQWWGLENYDSKWKRNRATLMQTWSFKINWRISVNIRFRFYNNIFNFSQNASRNAFLTLWFLNFHWTLHIVLASAFVTASKFASFLIVSLC